MKIKKIKKIQSEMDVTPTPRVLALFENLSVEPWRCIAELVDNSLDDFRANKNPHGKVNVYCENNNLYVADNGSGMSFDKLENAIKAGYSSKKKHDELGLFGVGFNIACARLGRKATVWTKRKSDKSWLEVEIDINKLVSKNTFKIQPNYVDIEDNKTTNGTIVAIELKREHLANFERSKYMKELANDLGRTYSYILRDSVPGLTGEVAGNPRNVEIQVGPHAVIPVLLCIWDENRYTIYRSSKVNAVVKFKKDLPDVSICNDCGNWHSTIITSKCENCESDNLSTASRLIWGWIGIQRYMDKLDFGINFLRNGRVILYQDQNIFSFTDPATGETFKDYPVEWPADQGRIVGEVHCDHVRVDFIKREFDVDDPYWRGVLEIVRGTSSLQPQRQSSASPNNSPLSEIFNAFRVNKPGLKYLIPGNGERAIHQATQNWGVKYREGDPDYTTDEKWYLAAKNHDEIASGATSTPTPGASPISPVTPTSPSSPSGNTPSTGGQTGSGPAPPANPAPSPSSGGSPSAPPRQTIKQKMDLWKSAGTQRSDLSKIVTPASIGVSYSIECWETFSIISDDNGNELSVLAVPTRGNEIVTFACKNADIFKIYGRNTTDLLLMEISNHIKTISDSSVPVTLILSEILSEFPDEEHSEKVLRSRIAELQTRLCLRFSSITADFPKDSWANLSKEEQEIAETNSVGDSSVVWSKAIKSGSFGNYLSLNGMKELVDKVPDKLFDGKLFKQHYASVHATEARQRAQGYISKALSGLSTISKLTASLSDYEIRLAEHSLDFLNEKIATNA